MYIYIDQNRIGSATSSEFCSQLESPLQTPIKIQGYVKVMKVIIKDLFLLKTNPGSSKYVK